MAQLKGPTMTDLRNRLNISYGMMSKALILDTVGWLIGNMLGGALYDKLETYMTYILIINYIILSVGTIAIPWPTTVPLFSLALFITALGKGGIDIGKHILKNIKANQLYPTFFQYNCNIVLHHLSRFLFFSRSQYYNYAIMGRQSSSSSSFPSPDMA